MDRALIFDFDGVIVQSEPLHFRTFREVVARFGIRFSRKRWYEEYSGHGSRNIFQMLLSEAGIKADIDPLVQERKRLYAHYVRQGVLRPTKGIKRFLSKLETGHPKLKTAIASGSHSSNIRLVLGKIGLSGRFDLIIGAEDFSRSKPDPECFLLAAKKLGKKPSDCIVVEDSIPGAEAARRAGMMLVCFSPPIAKRLNHSCIKVINSYSEFPLELLD